MIPISIYICIQNKITIKKDIDLFIQINIDMRIFRLIKSIIIQFLLSSQLNEESIKMILVLWGVSARAKKNSE